MISPEDLYAIEDARLQRAAAGQGPNEPEPCKKCEGRGFIVAVLPSEPLCPKCHGYGVK